MSEKELIYTVIQKAIEDSKLDLSKFKELKKRIEMEDIKKDAIKWLNSNSKKEHSFYWYCDLVGIDPSWAKIKLGQLKI